MHNHAAYTTDDVEDAQPIRREGASGLEAIAQTGDTIFLAGTGASPQGDKPFLDAEDGSVLQG